MGRVDKMETSEQKGMPYEQWRDTVTAWMAKEHSKGKSNDEIATALHDLWPIEWQKGYQRSFYRWYVRRQLLLTKNILDKYQLGHIGRPKSLNIRAIYALEAIIKNNCQKLGYSYKTSTIQNGWTIARIRDALHRWQRVNISGKTLRRVLKRLNYIWKDEEGWNLPPECQSTPGEEEEAFIHHMYRITNFEDWERSFVIDKINQTPPNPSLVENR